jgi:serine/threonine protein kinase
VRTREDGGRHRAGDEREAVKLEPGARLGPYVIAGEVGAGGMGEVYRARDMRLDRTVAIKVLPSAVSRDANVRQRFVREARAISSFSHPHVCQLYDIGSEGDVDYLVMEFLEGQSLADRLLRGALPLNEALRYAIELAKGLDAAHRLGIIHRDLKPGNVMLTRSGVKLVDFGLAAETAAAEASRETTMQAPLTAEGAIVGTLQYMSPEQIEGKQLDQRSDIFSFGAVVYEMVTGLRAFGGTSQASVITAIMSSEPPPITERAPASPAALERLVRKCLTKDPHERWQSVADIATALEWLNEAAPRRAAASRRMHFVVGALVAVALIAIGAAAYLAIHRETPSTVRFSITSDEPFDHGLDTHFALSPDGKQLAFVTTHQSRSALWVRTFDNTTPRLLTDAGNPRAPFWSPDGRNIAYFSGRELRRIAATGGNSEKLCETAGGGGGSGSWGVNGTIYFATLGKPGTVWQVAADGGTPRPLIRSANDPAYYWPLALPDGRHVLYSAIKTSHDLTLHAVGTDGKDDRALRPIATRVEYARGELFFLREGALVAQPFDTKSLTFSGTAREIAADVDFAPSIGIAAFSVCDSAMATHSGAYLARLSWFDRTGHLLRDLPFQTLWYAMRLSHAGDRLALTLHINYNQNVWLSRPDGSGATPLTYGPDGEFSPVWSPDDARIAYSSEAGGPPHIMVSSLGGQSTQVTPPTNIQYVSDWSPDTGGSPSTSRRPTPDVISGWWRQTGITSRSSGCARRSRSGTRTFHRTGNGSRTSATRPAVLKLTRDASTAEAKRCASRTTPLRTCTGRAMDASFSTSPRSSSCSPFRSRRPPAARSPSERPISSSSSKA